jgi:hypothetical protein
MYVDSEVIDAGARLLQGAADDGFPVDEEIEWAGLDAGQGRALHALLEKVESGDFSDVLRKVAERLPEPADDTEHGDARPAEG